MHGVEFPVCSFDLRSGIFCPKCEDKIRRGEITEADLKVMRLLMDMEKQIPQLAGITYKKSVEYNTLLFIIFKEGDLSKIPYPQQSNLRKRISDLTKLQVKLLEDSKDSNKFLQLLVAPARIMAVNKIWLPDQTEETRIILDEERNLKISPEAAAVVAKQVKGINLRIDFERRSRGYRRSKTH
ncbi:MAG: hypothetical protein NXY59_04405 [Aigarchaeota archaeon]|nr:hypothetical protein [Candidatus Pelearchaeum maunauluense]